MPTIRIDDEVYGHLQERATPLTDTPNSVLRRLLGLEGAAAEDGEPAENAGRGRKRRRAGPGRGRRGERPGGRSRGETGEEHGGGRGGRRGR